MCRSIKPLRTVEGPAPAEEVAAAALQFVRKISGYRAPPKAGAEAFDGAVADITAASMVMLQALGPKRASSRPAVTKAARPRDARPPATEH